MTELIGYIGSVLAGFSLGLIGGGGSILAVPIFVYLFGIEPVLATGYSLFVVGISSSVGAFNYMRKGLLDYKAAMVFAAPSFIAVYLTRHFLLPVIPNQFFTIGKIDITTDLLFILVLVAVMLSLSLLTLNLNYKSDHMHYRVFLLVTPAAIMVFIVRQFIIPALPHELFTIGEFTLTKNTGTMILFAVIMFLASLSMIRNRQGDTEEHGPWKIEGQAGIVFLGLLVGALTGMVGAGGGFLIIPALVLIAGLPIKTAVGTSLLIIAVNSLTGFLGDIHNQLIHWPFLLSFTGLSIIGIFLGTYVSRYFNNRKLKTGFGWFILLMSLYIPIRELFL